jgi:hypothetical protein
MQEQQKQKELSRSEKVYQELIKGVANSISR